MLVGVDIVQIDRIQKMIDKFGLNGLKKFLSEDELALVKKAQSVAGFFAAKEAASKAIGTGIGAECSWHDINISKTQKGQPVLKFSSRVVEKFDIENVSLSISHDGNFAIAVVGITTK